jgi:hypothetical protein
LQSYGCNNHFPSIYLELHNFWPLLKIVQFFFLNSTFYLYLKYSYSNHLKYLLFIHTLFYFCNKFCDVCIYGNWKTKVSNNLKNHHASLMQLFSFFSFFNSTAELTVSEINSDRCRLSRCFNRPIQCQRSGNAAANRRGFSRNCRKQVSFPFRDQRPVK